MSQQDLCYLSTGMSQRDLCYNFRVGRQSVSDIVKRMSVAIYDVLSPIYMRTQSPIYMRTQSTENEWKHIAEDFEELWDLPHCLGAIDRKYIGMDCPRKSGTHYHNYKDFFSMVLLTICNARYNFTLVDVGQYGCNNDSGVLGESKFRKAFEHRLWNIPAAEKIPGYYLEKVP